MIATLNGVSSVLEDRFVDAIRAIERRVELAAVSKRMTANMFSSVEPDVADEDIAAEGGSTALSSASCSWVASALPMRA